MERTLQPRPGERVRSALRHPATRIVVLLGILALIVWYLQVQNISGLRVLELSVRGVMLGAIIALGATGLTLVYGVLKFANFAHGDLMTLGAYVVTALLLALPQSAPIAPLSFGWEFLVALVLAMPVVGIVAFLIDQVIYKPLRRRRASSVILAMASLGMAFFVRSIIYMGWGADFQFFYIGRARPAIELFLGIRVRPDDLFILGLTVVLAVLVYLLLEKTKIGKAMRATADNPDLARVSGINTDRVVLWTWMIGGALAGAGGVMYGLTTQLRPELGWFLLLPLFSAVILGSIGNAYGALVGALIIGIAWQVSTLFIDPTYAPGVAFFILILVLLFKPQGIFGKAGA